MLFAICCFQLQRVKKSKRGQGRRMKNKMTIVEVNAVKEVRDDRREEGVPLH